jgi:protein SCO1/2
MLKTCILILLLTLAVVSAGCSSYEYKGSQLDPPLSVPDFELMADNGQPFRLSESDSDITLVFFGYTFCPDVCPTTMGVVKQAMAQLEPAQRARVQVVFISADPERDTPEVLSKYVDAFNPDFMGLTPEAGQLLEVMTPFGAYAEKEDVEGSATGYLVAHTARLYLLNAKREIMLTYPFGFQADELHSDLVYLLQQENAS